MVKDPLSKYTWVLWSAGFTPSVAPENYKPVVRATDKTGLDRNTGYHPRR